MANTVVQSGGWWLKECLRQQAGSYRRPRRPGQIGACRTQSVRGGIPTRSVGTINAVVQSGGWWLEECLRQQAGSYRRPVRPGEIGACRTQSLRGGIPTRSVGTITSNSNSDSFPAKAGPTVEVDAILSG
jgi:hypothetical protein